MNDYWCEITQEETPIITKSWNSLEEIPKLKTLINPIVSVKMAHFITETLIDKICKDFSKLNTARIKMLFCRRKQRFHPVFKNHSAEHLKKVTHIMWENIEAFYLEKLSRKMTFIDCSQLVKYMIEFVACIPKHSQCSYPSDLYKDSLWDDCSDDQYQMAWKLFDLVPTKAENYAILSRKDEVIDCDLPTLLLWPRRMESEKINIAYHQEVITVFNTGEKVPPERRFETIIKNKMVFFNKTCSEALEKQNEIVKLFNSGQI